MAGKQTEVLQWLKEVLNDSEIPKFERTESNINKLHQLMTLYKDAYEDVDCINSYIKTTAESYENYCKQELNHLKEIGVTSNFLDPEEQKLLDSLGILFYNLNLQSTSSSNVILAINSVEEEASEIEKSLKKERQFTKNLLKLSRNVASSLNEFKSIAKSAEHNFRNHEDEINKEKRRSQFNEEKLQKYKADIYEYQTKLSKAGFEDSLSFGSLAKQIQNIALKEKKVAEREKLLQSYNLPPDLALAEIKVEEKRQELALIMKNITQAYMNQS